MLEELLGEARLWEMEREIEAYVIGQLARSQRQPGRGPGRRHLRTLFRDWRPGSRAVAEMSDS